MTTVGVEVRLHAVLTLVVSSISRPLYALRNRLRPQIRQDVVMLTRKLCVNPPRPVLSLLFTPDVFQMSAVGMTDISLAMYTSYDSSYLTENKKLPWL